MFYEFNLDFHESIALYSGPPGSQGAVGLPGPRGIKGDDGLRGITGNSFI